MRQEVWMYQAALLCGPCAEATKEALKTAPGWAFHEEDPEGDLTGPYWVAPGGACFNAAGETFDRKPSGLLGRRVGWPAATDTDTFPADCAGLDSTSDCPEFCDRGEACLQAWTPPRVVGGPKPWPVGAWLENDLTREGLARLREEIAERPRNPVVSWLRRVAYRDALEA